MSVKYYLSLCVIIKDEMNIEEFIIYYRILGVEHFYIYDNECAYPLQDRLHASFFKDMCTILLFPGKCQQMNAYNHCIEYFKLDTNWLIIVDADEYIFPKKENHLSIRDFLNEYEEFHAIGINWVMFGTSYHDVKQTGFVIDKYRYCSNDQNQHIKTILKPLYVKYIDNPHYVQLIDPTKYRDPYLNIISGPFNHHYTIDIIQINHYWSRSVEDMIEKYNRGNADTYQKIVIPPEPHRDNNDKIDNDLPNKYLQTLYHVFNCI